MLILFFNDTATTEIYTLSLHDALPIFLSMKWVARTTSNLEILISGCQTNPDDHGFSVLRLTSDRKSTRLNSSHANISYAVFCLKKKQRNEKYIAELETDQERGYDIQG